MDQETRQLRKEAHQLIIIYGYIQATSEDQAFKLFMHIRSGGNSNPIDGLHSFDHNNVLVEEEHKESTTSAKVSDKQGIESVNTFVIKVPALPWTVVAGDEVVSELTSQSFTFDYLYVFPAIIRSTFFREMKAGGPTGATCCSPLLVNAIFAAMCEFRPLDAHKAQ